jgi:hypothetical protein
MRRSRGLGGCSIPLQGLLSTLAQPKAYFGIVINMKPCACVVCCLFVTCTRGFQGDMEYDAFCTFADEDTSPLMPFVSLSLARCVWQFER